MLVAGCHHFTHLHSGCLGPLVRGTPCCCCYMRHLLTHPACLCVGYGHCHHSALYNRCSTSSACEPLWAAAGVEGRPSSSSSSSSSSSTSTSSSTGDGDGDGGTSSSGSSSSGSGSTLDCSDGCYVPGSSTFCCPSYVGSRGFIRTSAYVSMILLIEISCVALAALGTSIYSLVRQQRRGDVPYPARSKAIVPGYVITYAVVHLTAEVLWAALPSVINGIFATLPLIVILSIVIATNCHCCCGLRKKPNGQRLVLLL